MASGVGPGANEEPARRGRATWTTGFEFETRRRAISPPLDHLETPHGAGPLLPYEVTSDTELYERLGD